ncbi:MAG: CBS domain-containing protein, partial [Chloroflexi bacterium]|nr:CBS domain-containing protein [Chloroflexota bacterium]
MRPAFFVPESKRVDEMLTEFQERRVHMAIIVDEYGGVAGIVTIEDLLEEIVGEIQDEFDVDEPVIERGPSGEAVVDARMPVDEFNAEFSADISPEGFDTLGGLLYARLGKIPEPGDVVNENGLRLQVITTTGRRIRRIRVVPEPRAVADPESEAGTGKDP